MTHTQLPLIAVHDGENLSEDRLVAEAYGHVAEGYRKALAVTGLPQIEADCLRAVLRAVLELAQQPQLSPAQSPDEDLRRSRSAG